jgi:DNA repair photolyase
MNQRRKPIRGRGAQTRPPNRFESVRIEADPDADSAFESSPEQLPVLDLQSKQLLDNLEPRIETQFLPDHTRSIIAENDSPDVGFRFSVNPYRGCEHGCVYCYARPTHEYLGFDAGLDFETRILVKFRAPELLREALCHPSWTGEVIVFSGNTDCYQPAERRFELTRRCLAVALEARQPIGIVTKNALLLRDLDILTELASRNLVQVNISVTSLDAELARTMEPRTSTPQARLDAIRRLSAAGIAVRVLVAPVIPGVNDQEIPRILQAVADAGARGASYVLLRLPLSVQDVFRDWLAKTHPLQAGRVESLIKATRGGRYYQTEFGKRMRGQGNYAEQIRHTFEVFAARYGLHRPIQPLLDSSQFRPPRPASGQMHLF